MIRYPEIITSLIENKASSAEAIRRAKEVRIEFFEKELGAKRIGEERRARAAAMSAALGLNYIEESLPDMLDDDIPVEDLNFEAAFQSEDDPKIGSEFIKVIRDEMQRVQEEPDPPQPELVEVLVGSEAEPAADPEAEAEAERIINEMKMDGEETTVERLTMMQKITKMNVKSRVKLALKGNREARNILRRDSNKSVILGVLGNPRITQPEVEAISAMKSLPEEGLRLIALNRQWIRSYPIIHHLVQNARTPVGTSLPLLNRLFPKDLKALTSNRNVPDVIRKQAARLAATKRM